ncbi:uncharacterized protein LOC107778425 [Nicotiana tabacum]|uniref:DUF4283 domain-containing protein n=1 Tax=Nicotiana tabacum TaxID=4097 RepID=A0A1S3YQB0_TOBAC|nr:PREDICTED: uncharacterized protein LOC107778425 [Nicotiana tabacum]XP_016454165.1 PREDICTED: uncharacterized protein LOC107778425 [Nicotiana tabacum]XP_016454166.1 PREDICTED: uncharacterized protein LOC107778425 [Nicotiana tabacum]
MELQAWTPNFNPNEDNHIIPIWIVIPELPWNFYYREVLSVLLSPIGKVLHLDLASMQKIRRSVAKVKMQVGLTKDKAHHVWLGFDKDQDVNGEGQWLEVVYEDLPYYCLYYRHLVHEEYKCNIRKREEQEKKNAATTKATTHNANNHLTNKLKGETATPHEQMVQRQQNYQTSNQKIEEQCKIEEQQGIINHKVIAQQTKKDNHSNNQWQFQKKKNFKGINQKNKQHKQKHPQQQALETQLSRPSQPSGVMNKSQCAPPKPLEIPEAIHNTAYSADACNGGQICAHEPPNEIWHFTGIKTPQIIHEST